MQLPPLFLRGLTSRSHRGQTGTRAFSLVEITLALGIAAFALTALVGMLPVGLETNASSRATPAAMRTAQQVIADLRLAEFPNPAQPTVFVSPEFQISLDKATGVTSLTMPESETTGGDPHRVEIKVLENSPNAGARGCYELKVDVIWGLPSGVTTVPTDYNNKLTTYAAILL